MWSGQLAPGGQQDFPFILYAQRGPRPAWSGTRDFHREKLLEVYEFLTREVMENGELALYARTACLTQDLNSLWNYS